METVVIVAIGVLAAIFLVSLVTLVVVCNQRYCHPAGLLQRLESKPRVDLISAMENQAEPSELELDDVIITNPHVKAILEEEDWLEDASGLMSHGIAVLKDTSVASTPNETNPMIHCAPSSFLEGKSARMVLPRPQICHTLTEKLVAMTMGSGAKVKAPNGLSDIIAVAKRINPRVDDVVRSMYPPLSPVLLDARATALFLSVSHLVLVTRHACRMSGNLDWIDQLLHTAEGHMVALREAALASETDCMQLGVEAVQQEHTI